MRPKRARRRVRRRAIAFFAVLRLAPAALFALLLKLLHAGALIVE
jgi:hypothetical protein